MWENKVREEHKNDNSLTLTQDAAYNDFYVVEILASHLKMSLVIRKC